tara:strand:- start:158 stop:529 length:372 start_codon:yes stop_codon:yes gene_type:complete
MSNKVLEDVAQTISNKSAVESKDENFGSIILTIMIIGIIVNLVKIVQDCKQDQSSKDCACRVKKICDRNSWYAVMRIKKAIRQSIGMEKYRTYGRAMVRSIMDTGNELTEEKLIEIVEAANNV